MRARGVVVVVVLLGLLAGGAIGGPALAQEGPSTTTAPTTAAFAGPQLTLDRPEVAPGEPIVVGLHGFTAQQVTVAVCGNLALRGSADCNMPSAQAERIRPQQEATLTEIYVHPPPVPCPCIVRASTPSNDQFAVAAITITGHPTGPLIEIELGELVELDVEAEPVDASLLGGLRTALGGPTTFAVTVSVRNITTQRLTNVDVSGVARHRLNGVAALDLAPTGPIEPGQTAVQTVRAEIPAPVLGRFTWEVDAYGAGPTVRGASSVSATPLLLYVVVLALLADLGAIVWRIRRRRDPGRSVADEPEEDDESWAALTTRWEADAAKGVHLA